MMPNWTESQRKAIETQNRSLLVSAGAGSGKTTVLTERILRRLIAGGDVSRLLVVTFTKAAASDMRHRRESDGSPSARPALPPVGRAHLHHPFVLL